MKQVVNLVLLYMAISEIAEMQEENKNQVETPEGLLAVALFSAIEEAIKNVMVHHSSFQELADASAMFIAIQRGDATTIKQIIDSSFENPDEQHEVSVAINSVSDWVLESMPVSK